MDEGLAWAAGLFEGEGCIYRVHQGANRLALQLNMVDEDVVRRFAAIVGAGNVYPRPQKGNRQMQYRWRTGDQQQVHRIMALFLPWLGVRRLDRYAELQSTDG